MTAEPVYTPKDYEIGDLVAVQSMTGVPCQLTAIVTQINKNDTTLVLDGNLYYPRRMEWGYCHSLIPVVETIWGLFPLGPRS